MEKNPVFVLHTAPPHTLFFSFSPLPPPPGADNRFQEEEPVDREREKREHKKWAMTEEGLVVDVHCTAYVGKGGGRGGIPIG